jgi:hypothetical protein
LKGRVKIMEKTLRLFIEKAQSKLENGIFKISIPAEFIVEGKIKITSTVNKKLKKK